MRALARELGVSVTAIQKGIRAGRFPTAIVIGKDGKPVVRDKAQAMVEWAASSKKDGASIARAEIASGAMPPVAPVDEVVVSASTLVEAQRIATLERYRKLRLENDVAEGRLVKVEDVEKNAFEAARIIRESMLNIAPRLASELAAQTDQARVYQMLDGAIRSALNQAADQIEAVH